MARRIKVLIVDDHIVVRQGLDLMLKEPANVEVVGMAGDGEEALAQAELLAPDVILMDLMMPRMNGVDATRRILAQRPEVRVLLMTGSDVEETILAAIRAGALGYLAKEAGTEELVRAIERVDRGEASLPASITRKLLARMDPPASMLAHSEALTPRELEILRLIAKGWSNQQIGDGIHVSNATVRTHVSHILAKLGVHNRVEATLYALRRGLATLEESPDAGGL